MKKAHKTLVVWVAVCAFVVFATCSVCHIFLGKNHELFAQPMPAKIIFVHSKLMDLEAFEIVKRLRMDRQGSALKINMFDINKPNVQKKMSNLGMPPTRPALHIVKNRTVKKSFLGPFTEASVTAFYDDAEKQNQQTYTSS